MSVSLVEVLEKAKAIGFLGPGPVEEHRDHALSFGRALEDRFPAEGRFADIGAGGGVPGLALLHSWPSWSGCLIDSSQKRCSFLVWALASLGLDDRAEVWCGRAEEIGRQDKGRGRFDAVVARGFGPPAATIECAAPLLKPNGLVAISEPPEGRSWPVAELGQVGLVQRLAGGPVSCFELIGQVPEIFPRKAKQQQQSPLFMVN